jgi:hypothetical protein
LLCQNPVIKYVENAIAKMATIRSAAACFVAGISVSLVRKTLFSKLQLPDSRWLLNSLRVNFLPHLHSKKQVR